MILLFIIVEFINRCVGVVRDEKLNLEEVILGPYHRNCHYMSTQEMLSSDFTVQSCQTLVSMSNGKSVESHCPFDHYFQSLCLLVLHTVRNGTKIVS